MDLEQFYKDVMEYDISPSVFEFDPQPQQGPISNFPDIARQPYEDTSPSGYLMKKFGFQQPYKSPEEIQAEEDARIEAEKRQQEETRKQWCQEFKNNRVTLNLTNVFGKMDRKQLKSIKSILDSDDDTTYIYAGSKNRSEVLSIDDVCAHVCKSKIKGNNLECVVEFDYSPAGMTMYNNYKNGYIPKLNLNTLFVYNQKDLTKQDMRFNCLEFI